MARKSADTVERGRNGMHGDEDKEDRKGRRESMGVGNRCRFRIDPTTRRCGRTRHPTTPPVPGVATQHSMSGSGASTYDKTEQVPGDT